MSRYRIASVEELPIGTMKRVECGEQKLCVANLEECGIRAIDDICTHEQESLSEGEIWKCEVECPLHGSRFSFVTGEVTGLPAEQPTRVYDVSVEGDDVYVEL
jgi:3-phenylpropionate/trans-cinnamate dioxygenase ferredoxin subunit